MVRKAPDLRPVTVNRLPVGRDMAVPGSVRPEARRCESATSSRPSRSARWSPIVKGDLAEAPRAERGTKGVSTFSPKARWAERCARTQVPNVDQPSKAARVARLEGEVEKSRTTCWHARAAG